MKRRDIVNTSDRARKLQSISALSQACFDAGARLANLHILLHKFPVVAKNIVDLLTSFINISNSIQWCTAWRISLTVSWLTTAMLPKVQSSIFEIFNYYFHILDFILQVSETKTLRYLYEFNFISSFIPSSNFQCLHLSCSI